MRVGGDDKEGCDGGDGIYVKIVSTGKDSD